MKKKVISFLLMISLMGIISFAGKNTTVYSDNISVRQGEIFTVPVQLQGNSGIMGTRLKFKYPNNVMELTDISSGELTQEGLFNTTVTDYYSVKGEFDIVWSNTEAVVGDGTFVMLTFEASDIAENGCYEINISYSQDDTFDEDMADVALECRPIKVVISDGTYVFEETTREGQLENPIWEETTENNNVSDDYLVSSVDSVVSSLNQSDIDGVTDSQAQQSILGFVNNRLDAFGEGIPHIENFEELKDKYFTALENEAVKDIFESTDGDEILSVYDDIKNENGIENLNDLPEEKKQAVIEKFSEKLTENNADLQNFNKLDIPKQLEVLGKVIEEVNEQEENSITVNQESEPKNSYKTIIIIISVVVVLAGATITTIVTVKRKKKIRGKLG